MRPCLNTLSLVSLALFPLPSIQGSGHQKASSQFANPQVFSCRGYLPEWGGAYASWGLLRNPSLELSPGRTGEIPDLTDLCSRRNQLIPIRDERNIIDSDVVEESLLYEGMCIDGRPEFLTVKEGDWRRAASVYLHSLGEENINLLWAGHQRVLLLCQRSCICQFSSKFRLARLKDQQRVRDGQVGQQHDSSFQPSKIPMAIPYRTHFERPYGPHFSGQGPVLEAAGDGAQDTCSAWEKDGYDDQIDGIPIRVDMSWRSRRQAQRERLKCIIDRENSLGG